MKETTKNGVCVWRCSVRSKDKRCHAIIHQVGDTWDLRNDSHSHEVTVDCYRHKLIEGKIRDAALNMDTPEVVSLYSFL